MNIKGVIFEERKVIKGESGEVKHLLKSTDVLFSSDLPFGEAYVSTIFPNVLKAWKLHTISTSRIACILGSVKFVLCDLRDDSPTKNIIDEIEIGENHYGILCIPNGIAYGWKNSSEANSILINISTHPHHPDDAKNLPENAIEYDWKQKTTNYGC